MDRQNDLSSRKASDFRVSSGQLSYFVTAKIEGLYKGLKSGSTQARARLARLRRSGAGDGRLWMLIGDDLFGDDLGGVGWNTETLGNPQRGNRYFDAALAALQLYAIHQQLRMPDGNTKGSDAADEDTKGKEAKDRANTDNRSASFGLACSRIGTSFKSNPSTEDSDVSNNNSDADYRNLTKVILVHRGVRRRLYAMERAVDFPTLLVYMRGLVGMLKTKDGYLIPLNYGVLAKDLCCLQFPASRDEVFRRWSKDFYSPKPKGMTQDDSASQ